MGKDFDKIIRKTLEQISLNYDQERMTVINALMSNVDLLLKNADSWFGEDVPDEYKRVIRSLFTLSNFLVENRNNYEGLTAIHDKRSIQLKPVLERMVKELMDILDYGELKINTSLTNEESYIVSSPTVLKEAIYNIFFSLYSFMKEDSRCSISIDRDNFNIKVDIEFRNLNDLFPGPSEIRKRIFTYVHDGEEKISIGIDSAVNSLRNYGAIVKVKELNASRVFSISLLFPSEEFHDSINRLRKIQEDMNYKKQKGSILAVIDDPMMHLLLDDVAGEYGLHMTVITLADLSQIENYSDFSAVIFDYSRDLSAYSALIEELSGTDVKLILIHGENDDEAESEFFSPFLKLMKPFSVDDIIGLL